MSKCIFPMAIILAVQGCALAPSMFTLGAASSNTQAQATSASSVTNPIIQALAPNPSSVVRKGDAITFTVVAYAPDNAALQYTWTATKGTLSATAGQIVSWTPQKSDGSFESGLATIQVILTNGKGGIAESAVNLTIAADGSATAIPAAIAPPLPAIVISSPSPSSVTTAASLGANLAFEGYTFRRHRERPTDNYGDNGDAMIQKGEVVAVDFTIKNVGGSSTQGITGVLTTSDALATLKFSISPADLPSSTNGVVPGLSGHGGGTIFTNIDAGQSLGGDDLNDAKTYGPIAWSLSGWILSVSSDCPAGHDIPVKLDLRDKYGNAWRSSFAIKVQ